MPSIALPVSLRGQLLSGTGSVVPPAFSPADLFATGSQGIWYDPSDLTTMFSDRAGTTPVTAPGQLVGLRLDKSKGLVLGSELVVNGTFDTDVTGWAAANGGTLSWDAQRAKVVVSNVGQGVTQTSWSPVAGRWYRVTFTITNGAAVARNFALTFGGFALDNQPINAGQSQTFTVTCLTNSTANLIIRNAGGTFVSGETFFYDNISVRELPGNHATAPTDAARVMYGVEPKGGRRNLLTYTEQFDNAAWTKTSVTVTANTAIAPDGTLTADLMTGGSNWFAGTATGAGAANQQLTGSIWVYPPAGITSLTIRIDRTGVAQGNQTVKTVVPETWNRVTHTATLDAGTAAPVLRIDLTGGASLTVWGAQLELGSTATAYQRVTSAFDVTEAGVQSCHYVQYDGSDDGMITNSIDFTATDKMSVFAGVRKLSDAAAGFLMELSADLGANSGSFGAWAPFSTTVEYAVQSRGTASSTSAQRLAIDNAAFVAPVSNVLTGLFDISGDTASARLNGASQGAATADQGTGNFGNHPLFFGRRGNASLPLNGRDFGIIVVGKAASAGEITDTETWLAAKTAQVTL